MGFSSRGRVVQRGIIFGTLWGFFGFLECFFESLTPRGEVFMFLWGFVVAAPQNTFTQKIAHLNKRTCHS
jgi:hypothetical protein